MGGKKGKKFFFTLEAGGRGSGGSISERQWVLLGMKISQTTPREKGI